MLPSAFSGTVHVSSVVGCASGRWSSLLKRYINMAGIAVGWLILPSFTITVLVSGRDCYPQLRSSLVVSVVSNKWCVVHEKSGQRMNIDTSRKEELVSYEEKFSCLANTDCTSLPPRELAHRGTQAMRASYSDIIFIQWLNTPLDLRNQSVICGPWKSKPNFCN